MPKTSQSKQGSGGGATRLPDPRKAVARAEQTTSSVTRRLTLVGSSVLNGSSGQVVSSGVTSAAEWAGLSARYVEFRVLAIILHFIPNGAASNPLIVSTDRSGALAAPASAAVAFSASGAQLIYPGATVGKVVKYEAFAKDLEDYNFDAVGSPTARYAVSMWNSSASAINYFVEWIVEFRGSR